MRDAQRRRPLTQQRMKKSLMLRQKDQVYECYWNANMQVPYIDLQCLESQYKVTSPTSNQIHIASQLKDYVLLQS